MDPARARVRAELGDAGVAEASGIVGIFNGLVRTADLSGIPLDDTSLHASVDFREQLGLNDFGGARNTQIQRGDASQAPERFFAPPQDDASRSKAGAIVHSKK